MGFRETEPLSYKNIPLERYIYVLFTLGTWVSSKGTNFSVNLLETIEKVYTRNGLV